MKRKIIRNIAIVSAIFIVSFTIMLITNYFQVKGVNPLQTEVVETLKQINDENANNLELQEQIRQLDLLARRAYFVRMDHLMTGVYILIAMLVALVVSLQLYFADTKNIPDKEIDPIDDWAIKTNARKYVNWVAGGLVVASLVFVLLTAPYLEGDATADSTELLADATQPETGEIPVTDTVAEITPAEVDTTATDTTAVEEEISKVTYNGFRGNNSNGLSTAKAVPTKWNLSTGENIAWQSKIPRQGYNSPVINGNKVFISGADDQARELYCYHLNTGEQLWKLAATNITGSPAQMPKTTNDTGLAASTVATNGKQVCAVFASGDLICADMDGNRLWAKNLGVPQNHYGYASSLLVFGSSLIVQYDNSNGPKVVALDMATGKERWSKSRTDKITWSSPIIAYINQKPQLILMGNPSITSYNPNNGEQYWRVEGLSGEVASSPCSSAGVVFGASEYASLIAVDGTTGETLWEASDFLPEVSSPVATKDNVYLATSYGVLACYDAKTGTLKQSHELNTEFYSSPVIAEGKLYVFSNDGKMHIYTANSDFKLINSFATGQKTFATPAFTDGKIVVRTESSIYCVALKKS
ncbi:outer membrane protein assembly factor BamB family protein [Viscerimonas tarda]